MGNTKLAKSKNKPLSVNSKSCMMESIQHMLVPSGFMRPLLELLLSLSICPWDIFNTLQLTHELASGINNGNNVFNLIFFNIILLILYFFNNTQGTKYIKNI